MKRALTRLLAAILCLLLLAGCGSPAPAPATELQRYSTAWYDVFDTVTTVAAYCESQQAFDAQMAALHDDLLAYHRLYDIYNEYEGLVNLCTVNRTAAAGPVQVDDRIFAMLEEAVRQYEVTGGRMNVAMGQVLRLWHDTREGEPPVLPGEDALAEAALHCDIADLVLDAQARTVFFADPALQLDVGACGKGYACEMAARAAQERGLSSATISVGGNVRNIGYKPGGSPWVIGVENPWPTTAHTGGKSYVCAVYCSDLAMVTSGDYQRYVEIDGVRYHHLIDPTTLQPARYCCSVTVLCSDSARADCLSTGLFCMSAEDGLALVDTLEGVEAFWCFADGTTQESSGWAEHLRAE